MGLTRTGGYFIVGEAVMAKKKQDDGSRETTPEENRQPNSRFAHLLIPKDSGHFDLSGTTGLDLAALRRRPHRGWRPAVLSSEDAIDSTLEERIDDFADTRAAVALVMSLADGLQHIHDLGIIHRDIKPSNIAFRGNGQVVLCNFGFKHAPASDNRYSAPEVVAGGAMGTASDVYSLGMVLRNLLSVGKANHDDASLDHLNAIVMRATASDPRARLGEALQFANHLRAWLANNLEAAPSSPTSDFPLMITYNDNKSENREGSLELKKGNSQEAKTSDAYEAYLDPTSKLGIALRNLLSVGKANHEHTSIDHLNNLILRATDSDPRAQLGGAHLFASYLSVLRLADHLRAWLANNPEAAPSSPTSDFPLMITYDITKKTNREGSLEQNKDNSQEARTRDTYAAHLDAAIGTVPTDASYEEQARGLEELKQGANQRVTVRVAALLKDEIERRGKDIDTFSQKHELAKWLTEELLRFNLAITSSKVGGVASLTADPAGKGGKGRFKLTAKNASDRDVEKPSGFNTQSLPELLDSVEIIEAPRRREPLRGRPTKPNRPDGSRSR